MNMSFVTYPSEWGRDTRHKFFTNDSDTLVVGFPGMQYSCELPLLHYACSSALEHKLDVLLLEYGYQSARADLSLEQLPIIVAEAQAAIDHIRGNYERLIFVSKSLGTIIAGQVADRISSDAIRHIYLTPLDDTVPYIQRSSGVVIYGTQDSLFSSESAQAVAGLEQMRIVPVPNGNHVLEVSSTLDSLDVLKEIASIYNSFFGTAPL
ncbi:hypothetical protein L5D93_24880 [Paenibacillus thiaminolyticus]|nr:hypothetical protein [Paenibacillus thiaminolyticus]